MLRLGDFLQPGFQQPRKSAGVSLCGNEQLWKANTTHLKMITVQFPRFRRTRGQPQTRIFGKKNYVEVIAQQRVLAQQTGQGYESAASHPEGSGAVSWRQDDETLGQQTASCRQSCLEGVII